MLKFEAQILSLQKVISPQNYISQLKWQQNQMKLIFCRLLLESTQLKVLNPNILLSNRADLFSMGNCMTLQKLD